MTKKYTFACEETNPDGTTSTNIVSFTTENDSWVGVDGPLFKFHDFLKGCGYLYQIDDQIGVMSEDRGFISALEF